MKTICSMSTYSKVYCIQYTLITWIKYKHLDVTCQYRHLEAKFLDV